MNNNSDPIYDQYSNMDFNEAKSVSDIPALARLQTEHGGKSRVTMRLDNDVLAFFKARAEITGGNYQSLINQALRDAANGITLVDVVKKTIRQELHAAD